MTLVLSTLRCPQSVAPETRRVTGGEFAIGRGPDNDWVLPDPERHLSKRHCVFAFRSGGWQVADTSTNGTFFNREGQPIGDGGTRELRDGDRVRFGPYEIEIRIEEDAAAVGGGFAAAPSRPSGADPFGSPFGGNVFAPPTPPPPPFGEDPLLAQKHAPGPVHLPADFDPFATPSRDDALGFPTQADHSPAFGDAFRPPRTVSSIPDNWDLGIGAPAGQEPSSPFGQPAGFDSQPPPSQGGFGPVHGGAAAAGQGWGQAGASGFGQAVPGQVGFVPPGPAQPGFVQPGAGSVGAPSSGDPFGVLPGGLPPQGLGGGFAPPGGLPPFDPAPRQETPSPFGERPDVLGSSPFDAAPLSGSPHQAGGLGGVAPGPFPGEPGSVPGPGAERSQARPLPPAGGFGSGDFLAESGRGEPVWGEPFPAGGAANGARQAPLLAPGGPVNQGMPPIDPVPVASSGMPGRAASPFDEPGVAPVGHAPAPAAPVQSAPVTAAPVQSVVNPSVPVAPGELLGAFLQGAGMPGAVSGEPVAMMAELGRAFRALVAGLRETLIARAAVKGEFRIEQTMIRSRGNNPLKFSAGDDDALSALLGIGRRVDMAPSAAVADALRDIRLHELASVAAMQSAVRALLARLDPEPLRREAEAAGGLTLVPAQKKARAWDAFEKLHAQTTEALSDDFDSVFGRAFARAYEQALEDVARADRKGAGS